MVAGIHSLKIYSFDGLGGGGDFPLYTKRHQEFCVPDPKRQHCIKYYRICLKKDKLVKSLFGQKNIGQKLIGHKHVGDKTYRAYRFCPLIRFYQRYVLLPLGFVRQKVLLLQGLSYLAVLAPIDVDLKGFNCEPSEWHVFINWWVS